MCYYFQYTLCCDYAENACVSMLTKGVFVLIISTKSFLSVSFYSAGF